LQALHNLGGSSSVPELEEEVSKVMNLSDGEINEIHKGGRTKLNYRLAWARNYLKRYGLLEDSARGIWALTPNGLKTESVDKEKVKKHVIVLDRENRESVGEDEGEQAGETVLELNWQDELLEVLMRMEPSKFERLCQRVLRESGFVNVEVTGRTGDGGIDGKGVLRLGGVLSFHMMFQCKRHK
jgi:restriction system protein